MSSSLLVLSMHMVSWTGFCREGRFDNVQPHSILDAALWSQSDKVDLSAAGRSRKKCNQCKKNGGSAGCFLLITVAVTKNIFWGIISAIIFETTAYVRDCCFARVLGWDSTQSTNLVNGGAQGTERVSTRQSSHAAQANANKTNETAVDSAADQVRWSETRCCLGSSYKEPHARVHSTLSSNTTSAACTPSVSCSGPNLNYLKSCTTAPSPKP
eukprot:3092576-Amphidinium_carterae.1